MPSLSVMRLVGETYFVVDLESLNFHETETYKLFM
jgi:hypothetical protein